MNPMKDMSYKQEYSWLSIPNDIMPNTLFLISNKDVYSRTPPNAESHKAEIKNYRKKDKKTERKDTNYKVES